jgi:hypothetical protein
MEGVAVAVEKDRFGPAITGPDGGEGGPDSINLKTAQTQDIARTRITAGARMILCFSMMKFSLKLPPLQGEGRK